MSSLRYFVQIMLTKTRGDFAVGIAMNRTVENADKVFKRLVSARLPGSRWSWLFRILDHTGEHQNATATNLYNRWTSYHLIDSRTWLCCYSQRTWRWEKAWTAPILAWDQKASWNAGRNLRIYDKKHEIQVKNIQGILSLNFVAMSGFLETRSFCLQLSSENVQYS